MNFSRTENLISHNKPTTRQEHENNGANSIQERQNDYLLYRHNAGENQSKNGQAVRRMLYCLGVQTE